MISILIPVYNYNCTVLVEDLQKQCMQANVPFEILVLDDTSTKFKAENRAINALDNCRYVEAKSHIGPAKIRNELGEMAQYEHIVFIDSDAVVDNSNFIQTYLDAKDKAQVVIGGMTYSKQPPKENALRWYYGSKREDLPASIRNKNPYKSLISFNFMMERNVFNEHPFDESSLDMKKKEYGHEDTLLGLRFKKHNISVYHIDNQLIHNTQESNEVFMNKSLKSVERYVTNPRFKEWEVVSQIKIFRVFQRLKSFGAVGVLSLIYIFFGDKMRRRLFQPNPPIRLFDLYRLSHLANFYKKN